jgi:hypothetical protein
MQLGWRGGPVDQGDDVGLRDGIKAQAVDYVTSGVKAGLGLVPFAGSLLSEIAGSVIPRQRVDRIADFAVQLEDRIRHLEVAAVTSQLDDEEFTELVEEALRQASRATTQDRRSYLASLVANSLTSDAIKHAESRHLMRLLGELNDVEVLWLRFFEVPTTTGDEEFRRLHEDVFEPRPAYMNSSAEEFDQQALQESYKAHLIQLGLVNQKLATDRDGNPEVDVFSDGFKFKGVRTSRLGNLMLRSIGMVGGD